MDPPSALISPTRARCTVHTSPRGSPGPTLQIVSNNARPITMRTLTVGGTCARGTALGCCTGILASVARNTQNTLPSRSRSHSPLAASVEPPVGTSFAELPQLLSRPVRRRAPACRSCPCPAWSRRGSWSTNIQAPPPTHSLSTFQGSARPDAGVAHAIRPSLKSSSKRK